MKTKAPQRNNLDTIKTTVEGNEKIEKWQEQGKNQKKTARLALKHYRRQPTMNNGKPYNRMDGILKSVMHFNYFGI